MTILIDDQEKLNVHIFGSLSKFVFNSFDTILPYLQIFINFLNVFMDLSLFL